MENRLLISVPNDFYNIDVKILCYSKKFRNDVGVNFELELLRKFCASFGKIIPCRLPQSDDRRPIVFPLLQWCRRAHNRIGNFKPLLQIATVSQCVSQRSPVIINRTTRLIFKLLAFLRNKILLCFI